MTSQWVKVPVAAVLDARLSAVGLRVLSYLAHRQGGNGHCWPSLSRIAEDLRTSQRTIQRALGEIVSAGYASRTYPERQGRGRAVEYRIVKEKGDTGDTLPSEKVATSDTLFPKKGDKNDPKRVTRMATQLEPRNRTNKITLLFEQFWATYPRKVSKGSALRAWLKLRPTEDLTKMILAAIDRQRASEQWRIAGGKYIPHPASWLNGQRWLDELPSLPDSSSSGTLPGDVRVARILARIPEVALA